MGLRLAALDLIARDPSAANQLTRAFPGDSGRQLRRAANAHLRANGVSRGSAKRLAADLARARGADGHVTLTNLASSYGHSPDIVALLLASLAHADEPVRVSAMHGLAQLGETDALAAILADAARGADRIVAAELLGRFGSASDAEAAALRVAREDAPDALRKAARTALRRLGLAPIPPPGTPSGRARGPLAGRYAWQALLERVSAHHLADDDYRASCDDDVIAGASEPELAALESRLGLTLPPSYRELLATSNGWPQTTSFIARLFSADEVDRFARLEPEWLAIALELAAPITEEEQQTYGEDQDTCAFDARHLESAIQISARGDSAVFLLNPRVVSGDGEWEAWFFATWLPGARRYRSLWEMMHAETRTNMEPGA
ncbi:MAG: SMI1/KNR4 family protein [Myxococcota bacterium]